MTDTAPNGDDRPEAATAAAPERPTAGTGPMRTVGIGPGNHESLVLLGGIPGGVPP